MKRFRIVFRGCPKGRLNTAMKERVVRVVEAEDEKAAAWKAYDTHEHIWNGVDGVRVTEEVA